MGVPVIANGDIRSTQDVQRVIDETGVDGMLKVEPLYSNPLKWTLLTVEYVLNDILCININRTPPPKNEDTSWCLQ